MEKTQHQLLRFIQKIADKFPQTDEPTVFTDIHVRVAQDNGDVMAFDDDDNEITRVVVEEWIDNDMETEDFYRNAYHVLHEVIDQNKPQLGVIEPYNYVLENDGGEHIAELYVIDDSETDIIGGPFLEDITADLDDFIENLLKD